MDEAAGGPEDQGVVPVGAEGGEEGGGVHDLDGWMTGG
jgi:hypothetical protein